jgi:hypothetical protein
LRSSIICDLIDTKSQLKTQVKDAELKGTIRISADIQRTAADVVLGL